MPKILLIIIITFLIGIILPFIYGAHWAFYLYELTYFFNPENRWWFSYIPSLPYSKITVIIFLLVFFIHYKKYQKNQLMQLPQFKWIILLIFSYIGAYFYAIAPFLHEKALIEFIKLFIILGIAYKVLDSQKKLEWALVAYLLGVAYLSYETFVLGRNSNGRVEGMGVIDAPDSNGASATLVPALPLLIFYFLFASNKIRVMLVVAGGLIVNALILINSRGAFVGGAVSVSYFLWGMYFSSVKLQYQKLIVMVVIIFGCIGLYVLIDDSFYQRMNTLTEVQDGHKSGSHRYRMWLSTFDLLEDYPFGVGAYGYEYLSKIYVDSSLFFHGQKRKAVHSIWFQALSEVGWHGFFFFMMLISSTYFMAKRSKKISKQNNNIYQYYLMHALLSSYLGVLATSTFLNQFRVQMVYWTILFILCLYTIVQLENKDDSLSKQSHVKQEKK
jgi:hypothetical protein